MIDRRTLMIGAPFFAAACATAQSTGTSGPEEQFHALCAGLGRSNRLGVAVLDTGSGRRWAYQPDSRFAMASTFKVPLAAAILTEADAGRLALAQEIAFGEADLLEYAPVVRANAAAGRLSIERLCAAMVEVSDNSAANLLLRLIGGPGGLTAFIRASGDGVTRLDRPEPDLNANDPGDPRDTTTPAAMAGLLRNLLLGDRLSPQSRTRLIGWMESSTTGRDRLRAGFPPGWRAGDKTGTGARGVHNDVAIVWPPRRPPLIVTSYLDAPDHLPERRLATHVAVARIIAQHVVIGVAGKPP
jgi:beta-lactamase class A